MLDTRKKRIIAKTSAILLALAVWQILSICVGSDILLVSPIEVVKRLFTLVAESEFLSTVSFTLLRIAVGFFAGLVCGVLVALGVRYLCHILSGYILFGSYAEWFFTQDGFPAWGAQLVQRLNPTVLSIVYSIVYNGMYMIPEMIVTSVAALCISRIPKVVTKV